MPETGQEDHLMLSNSSIFPEAMSLETALSISIIIATLLASVVTIMMLFARLAPSQRRDLIRLVRQLHRSRHDS
jgi:hypothetical protein